MRIEEKIAGLVAPVLESLDFALVRVRYGGSTLQIMAEPVDAGRTMTVDDCAAISREVSAVLDVADPISESFSLEISSPGLARPLTRFTDFARFEGELARITLKPDAMIEGRRRFRGRLGGIKEGANLVLLETADVSESMETQEIAFEAIAEAKLDPVEILGTPAGINPDPGQDNQQPTRKG